VNACWSASPAASVMPLISIPELESLLGGLFKLKAFHDHRGAQRNLLQLGFGHGGMVG
jgi:hypothetical protein